MTFTLDTSGIVRGGFNVTGYLCWDDLSPFAQRYIAAMTADLDDKRVDSLGGVFSPAFQFYVAVKFSDIAPEALASILADCERFAREFPGWDHRDGGALFWAHRQGGDTGWPAYMAEGFPPVRVYLDDAGKVQHVTEEA